MFNVNLVYSILFGIAAFAYYKVHKYWLRARDENPIFFKLNSKVGVFKNWFFIIALSITSVVLFFKSFKTNY